MKPSISGTTVASKIIYFGTASPADLGDILSGSSRTMDGERRSPYMDVLARVVLKGYPQGRRERQKKEINFETVEESIHSSVYSYPTTIAEN